MRARSAFAWGTLAGAWYMLALALLFGCTADREQCFEPLGPPSPPRAFWIDAGKPIGGTGLDTMNAWPSLEDALQHGSFVPGDTLFVRHFREDEPAEEEEPPKDHGLEPVVIIPRVGPPPPHFGIPWPDSSGSE